MAKFDYRLQSVLNIKEQLEDEAKSKLARRLKKLDEEQKTLHHIHRTKRECFNNIMKESVDGIQAEKLCQYNRYLSSIDYKLNRQAERVENVSKDVDHQRQRLIEVAKEKKILKSLKEKRWKDFLFQQMKIEEKRIDEVVSYKYANK